MSDETQRPRRLPEVPPAVTGSAAPQDDDQAEDTTTIEQLPGTGDGNQGGDGEQGDGTDAAGGTEAQS